MKSYERYSLKDLAESEEELARIYSDLENKASLDNIKMFLNTFAKGHENIAAYLEESNIRKSDIRQKTGRYRNIHATDHLAMNEEVDLGNLQSVLLFISKTESDSLHEYERTAGRIKDTGRSKLLETVRSEKSAMVAKADRLYFDFIESRVS
ncbi:MAG: hypothetical protein QXN26_02285 [Thermoplasmataceae archaeon]